MILAPQKKVHLWGVPMADIYGKGLVVYTNRWKSENNLFARFFPVMRATLEYRIRSLFLARRQARYLAHVQRCKTPPPFAQVEVETQNRCNASCAFCPVNRNEPQRPYARMSDGLFTGIIEQLAALQYTKALSLHSNNEPLLDKRLPDFAAFARQRLPSARIKLFTNGMLLSLDLFRTLLPSFDRIFINNYADKPEMLPNIREIHDYCLTPEGKKFIEGKSVVIQLRNPDVVLSSRGGNAPNRKPPARALPFKCLYPFTQFIIRPDGKISLCCNDALGQMTLGDLNEEKMINIWRGPAFADVRKKMIEQGRAGIPLCAACDFLH